VLQKTIGIALSMALLVGGVAVGREVLRPATVTLEEYGIILEPGETRTIRANTSGGLPFGEGIRWQIEPSWLGTISENGDFHAGVVRASGSVIARFGSASAETPVAIACPKEARVQGIRFAVSCGRFADVYVDVSTYGGAEAAAAAVDREASRISRDLEITSERRFRVYFFGTRQGFIAGISELSREFASAPTDPGTDAVYIDVVDAIAIDRSADLLLDPQATLRHELVHRFLRHYVGYANIDEIPMWLNEGWALLEESDQAGRLLTEARLVAASMANLGKLPSLRSLTDIREWNGRTGVEGLYQYYAAAQATQFMIDDIKPAGLHGVLKHLRAGDSWSEALSRGAPELDFDDFAYRFSSRVAHLVETYPGIAVAGGTPYGPGTTVIAYGLGPSAFATLKAKGPIERKMSGKIDEFGVYVGYMGGEFPTGDYILTLETEGKHLTVNVKH
jgi:hypothetical protein